VVCEEDSKMRRSQPANMQDPAPSPMSLPRTSADTYGKWARASISGIKRTRGAARGLAQGGNGMHEPLLNRVAGPAVHRPQRLTPELLLLGFQPNGARLHLE
jgi:hypothetical protein